MAPPTADDLCRPFVEKMEAAGLPQPAVATFCHHLRVLAAGEAGTLGDDAILPVDSIADAEDLSSFQAAGATVLARTVVIKLNGGLGTGMGLEGAKSLLPVRPGVTFLDLILRQVLHLRRLHGCQIPLLFMNSFRTEQDTARRLRQTPELELTGLPLGFNQHRVPKVIDDGLTPARWPKNPELEWCPPGHGDLYTALHTTGVLDLLLNRGFEYAFASNSDNLGAVLDLGILGRLAEHRLGFLMEAADRTAADRKGGHLCRLADGRLALREFAQCPPGEEADFQNVERHRYFNTNNLWLHLPSLRRLLDRHAGVLPLATIVNHKTLDPRNPGSPAVTQLETAMGAALSLFDGAEAVRVPRSRFSPVKNADDLLGVRSDAFRLTDDGRIVLHESREAPPVVSLDGRYYTMIDDFEARFPDGPPSLLACDELAVEGDVTFGRDVILTGRVRITAAAPAHVPDGTTLTGDVNL